MTVKIDAPTCRELDAAERVLAESHGMRADGYFRELGRSVLEAASDAGLQEFIEDLDTVLAEHRVADAPTTRRCVRCGISSTEAREQGESICNDNGLVGGHSFRDDALEVATGGTRR